MQESNWILACAEKTSYSEQVPRATLKQYTFKSFRNGVECCLAVCSGGKIRTIKRTFAKLHVQP